MQRASKAASERALRFLCASVADPLNDHCPPHAGKKSKGQKYQKFKEDVEDMNNDDDDDEIEATRNGNGAKGDVAAGKQGLRHEQQHKAASRAKKADGAESVGAHEPCDMEI